MKKMFRYGLVGLTIAVVAMLEIGQVTAQEYPPRIVDALRQELMLDLFGDLLHAENVTIVFGDADGEDLAKTSYNAAEETYTITIDWAYEYADLAVLKALLAHELTHVSWGTNGFGPLTFEEEYDCWQTEAEIWRYYKDGLTNKKFDDRASTIYANDYLRDRDEVKKFLERIYNFAG
jgi:hypothetical protein